MEKKLNIIASCILIIFCFVCGIWCLFIDYYTYAGFLIIFGIYNAYRLIKQIKEQSGEDNDKNNS